MRAFGTSTREVAGTAAGMAHRLKGPIQERGRRASAVKVPVIAGLAWPRGVDKRLSRLKRSARSNERAVGAELRV